VLRSAIFVLLQELFSQILGKARFIIIGLAVTTGFVNAGLLETRSLIFVKEVEGGGHERGKKKLPDLKEWIAGIFSRLPS
jgi:hypothetical protein